MEVRNSWAQKIRKSMKDHKNTPTKTFSKLPTKKPAVSLGLAESYISSIQQTFVVHSEIIGTSLSGMAPIPYFKMTNTFFVLNWWSQIFKLVQTRIIDFILV